MLCTLHDHAIPTFYNQEGETPHITCSNTNFEKAEADQDVFTFTNLSGAEIHPGATCTVYGCYRIEIDAVVDVLAPIKNCTIKGEWHMLQVPVSSKCPRNLQDSLDFQRLSTTIVLLVPKL